MARPKKQTVDYFPHIIKQGKTITILENRFGNDGYAFWFKLLEILGSTEGHCYRYENTADIEFLLAKTLVERETAENILGLLAELEAIDKKLWEKGYIWSDNFIDNIADVYKKRSGKTPKKPVFGEKTPPEEEFPERKPEEEEVSGNINPQSKVKESKVNKNKDNISPKLEIEKIYNTLSDYWKQLFKDYIEIYKSQNATGKITDNRHYNLLNEIYQIYVKKKFEFNGKEYRLPDKIMETGLNKIIEKNIDSLNYAKKVWIGEPDKKPAKKREKHTENRPIYAEERYR